MKPHPSCSVGYSGSCSHSLLTPHSAEGVPFPSGTGSWWDSSRSRCVAEEIQLKLNIRLTCLGCGAVGILCLPGCSLLLSQCVFCSRIHISVQIPHQDGMLPLISTLPLHNLHFLLSESIYRHQHVCSNLVTVRDLRGISGNLQHQPACFLKVEAWKEVQRGQLCLPLGSLDMM